MAEQVRKEGRLPGPIGGGVEVLEHRPNLNQGHDFNLFAKGPGKRGGQVVHEQVDLGNQDDGKGGVQGLERVGEQADREGQKPPISRGRRAPGGCRTSPTPASPSYVQPCVEQRDSRWIWPKRPRAWRSYMVNNLGVKRFRPQQFHRTGGCLAVNWMTLNHHHETLPHFHLRCSGHAVGRPRGLHHDG